MLVSGEATAMLSRPSTPTNTRTPSLAAYPPTGVVFRHFPLLLRAAEPGRGLGGKKQSTLLFLKFVISVFGGVAFSRQRVFFQHSLAL